MLSLVCDFVGISLGAFANKDANLASSNSY